MKFIFLGLLVLASTSVNAQKYYTKNGRISLDATSNASLERIEAVNRMATCVIDSKSGNVQFALLMKGFEFERALMQEHFNENYVESEKFPKSEFKGSITNNPEINYSKDGVYPARVKGLLTMHGETRAVETPGKIVVRDGRIQVESSFPIKLSDYNITIPGLVADKVSKTATISISCSLELFKG